MCNAKIPWQVRALILFAAFGLISACAFHPQVPSEFAHYPRGWIFNRSLKAMSPDGVLFTVRCEKNKPRAEIGFWREAMKTRMTQAGYRILEDTTCSMQGKPGRIIKLATPYGNQDYFYWIAFSLNESGKRLLVAEAAGESKVFLKRQASLEEAIAKSGWESK